MYNEKLNKYVFCKKDQCDKYLKDGYIFRGKSFGKKLSFEACKNISINHADVSGKNNPMYGHTMFEFMTDEQILSWRQKIKARKYNGENNPCYNKKWIKHKSTNERLYLDKDTAEKYVNTGYWEYGVSLSIKQKTSATLKSSKTQLKNLKTRFPNIDFSEFNYEEYRLLNKIDRIKYREKYFLTHTIKLDN